MKSDQLVKAFHGAMELKRFPFPSLPDGLYAAHLSAKAGLSVTVELHGNQYDI